MENWKDIEGYEGLYQVSDKGRIKSLAKRFGKQQGEIIMRPSMVWCGYMRIGLTKDKKPKQHAVHRLVAQAFIPNPENKPVINHLDGDRTNNCVENLEWATYKENSNSSIKLKTSKRYNSVRVSDSMGHVFDSYREAGRFWGLCPNTIKNDCLGISPDDLKRKVRFKKIEKE